MEIVLRAAAVYLLVLLIFRIAGRKALSEVSTFDLVLLLIMSEATQNALIGQDYSFTAALLAISTLVALNVVLSWVLSRSRGLDTFISGMPLIIVADGQPLLGRMKRARIDVNDVLEQARKVRGIYKLDDIKFAILERGGGISIIPFASGITAATPQPNGVGVAT